MHSQTSAQYRLCAEKMLRQAPNHLFFLCHIVYIPQPDLLWGHNKWVKLLQNLPQLFFSPPAFCDQCVLYLKEKFKAHQGFPEMHSFLSFIPLCTLRALSSQLFGGLSWRMQCLPPLSTEPAEGCPSKRCWSTSSLSWICPVSDWHSTHPKLPSS